MLLPDTLDNSSEIIPCPDNGDGVQRIGFLGGPGDHLVDVFVLNHIELAGQAHLFVGFFDPADEVVGLFCFIGTADAADISQICQTLVSGCAEFPHDMGQQNGHSQTVGDTVQTAQGMTDGVDIADTATGEGTACEEGATLHILTGFQILAIFKRQQNIVVDQLDSFLSQLVFQLGVVGFVGISFHSMGRASMPVVAVV